MMKLSDVTFDVLKNFSTINQSLAFKAGNVIRTVSPQKNILAQATVSESFPKDFAIYELNQFLGLVSLFDDADLEFDTNNMVIAEGTAKANYTYADPSMITAQPPEKNIELPSVEVQFKMTKEDYRKVQNGANQLQLPEVVVRGRNGIVELVATDTKNPTSNEFSRSVGENGADFQFIFKTENLKFLQMDYDVEISSKGIAHFKGEGVEYWVATEAGSSYEG
jgi:hypothetical protein